MDATRRGTRACDRGSQEDLLTMLTLYYAPGACSMASHIGLEETGAPYETRLVSFANYEQRSEAYLKINSRGRGPPLSADGAILVETTATLTSPGKEVSHREAAARRSVGRGPLHLEHGLVFQHGASVLHSYQPARALRRRPGRAYQSQGYRTQE